jgi:hypothetical protein
MLSNKIENEIERITELIETTDGNSFFMINETSLSRIWSYTNNYDIAIVSASRNSAIDCLDGYNDQSKEYNEKYTKKENTERTRELKAYLLKMGYGVTDVMGTWIENFDTKNSVEVSESSLFVVNLNNDSDFFNKIKSVGVYYCQDAVLLKPIGEDAYLYGTNSAWPRFGNVEPAGSFKGGVETQYMTKVNKNRAFTFMEDYGPTARYFIDKYSKNIEDKLILVND